MLVLSWTKSCRYWLCGAVRDTLRHQHQHFGKETVANPIMNNTTCCPCWVLNWINTTPYHAPTKGSMRFYAYHLFCPLWSCFLCNPQIWTAILCQGTHRTEREGREDGESSHRQGPFLTSWGFIHFYSLGPSKFDDLNIWSIYIYIIYIFTHTWHIYIIIHTYIYIYIYIIYDLKKKSADLLIWKNGITAVPLQVLQKSPKVPSLRDVRRNQPMWRSSIFAMEKIWKK